MREYYKFSKKHFEYELKGITIRNKFKSPILYTEEYINLGNETWEHIYLLPTKNKSVDILIYSSIDVNTNKVRDNGSDAVRVVLRWSTKNGFVFKAIHTHYRLKTLFNNLERTIINTQSQVFDLNYKEFGRVV
jgi:hypothetical protein